MIASLLAATLLLTAPTPASSAAATPVAAPPARPAASAAAPVKPAATPGAAPAAMPAAGEAPKAPISIETKVGHLEFSHPAHGALACARCHPGPGAPGKLGMKGKEAAHKFCVACHKAEQHGPFKCTACHQQEAR